MNARKRRNILRDASSNVGTFLRFGINGWTRLLLGKEAKISLKSFPAPHHRLNLQHYYYEQPVSALQHVLQQLHPTSAQSDHSASSCISQISEGNGLSKKLLSKKSSRSFVRLARSGGMVPLNLFKESDKVAAKSEVLKMEKMRALLHERTRFSAQNIARGLT
jgi:hypothetical protein